MIYFSDGQSKFLLLPCLSFFDTSAKRHMSMDVKFVFEEGEFTSPHFLQTALY